MEDFLAMRPYIRNIEFIQQQYIDWSEFPFNIPAVQHLDKINFHANVTFFVGENGSGKSTVLEAIAKAFGLGTEGGNRNIDFKTTNKIDTGLEQHLRLIKSFKRAKDAYFLRAESFYNIATYMDNLDDPAYLTGFGGGSLHTRSHGEAFMAMLLHKFKGNGLYLLDEPEAALSPTRLLAALVQIDELVKNNSQFIIATHSPILLAYPNAQIFQFDYTGIRPIDYTDTEHYFITKDFLNHFPARLKELLT